MPLVVARVNRRRPCEPHFRLIGAHPHSRHQAVPDQDRRRVLGVATIRSASLRGALAHEATCSALGATVVAPGSLVDRVAMCFATHSASLPVPPMSIDVNECRKSSPTK
jgi:hypothetical protein